MAKSAFQIFGTVHGKIGNVIGYVRNGKQYFRQLPAKSDKAPTEEQTTHRAKFSLACKFLKPINGFLNSLPPKAKMKCARASTALGLVMKSIEANGKELLINYPEVILCEGTPCYLNCEISVSATGFSFHFSIPEWVNQSPDQIYLLIYLPEYNIWNTKRVFFDRQVAQGSVEYEGLKEQTPAEMYTICTFDYGSKVSSSSYVGSFNIPKPKGLV